MKLASAEWLALVEVAGRKTSHGPPFGGPFFMAAVMAGLNAGSG